MKTIFTTSLLLAICLISVSTSAFAQPITGVWKGRVKSSALELKIIKNGDSLTGTSYYYHSKNNYRRYSIKGYFDPQTNEVIWWDDVLLNGSYDDGKDALLHVADFNCPGEDKMLLEGSSTLRDDKDVAKGNISLQKITRAVFNDEWDWVIENYTLGANAPEIIDSIGQIAAGPQRYPEEKLPAASAPIAAVPQQQLPQTSIKAPAISNAPPTAKSKLGIQEKFTQRQNKLQMVIPVTAPMIELKFYDNAAIDGDSIALFLNRRLLKEHILLGSEPQIIKIPAVELQADNELVLVAENLGSIPPNTSYLVAVVGSKQYEARLFADEGSSALIRFIKEKENNR